MEKKKFEESSSNIKFEDGISQIGLDNFSDFYNSTDCSNYKKYAQRIKKSLYYGRISKSARPSLSVTGILVEKFSELCNQDGLDNLEIHDAASICYDACVTPCSVIVALLYLDRLRKNNPDYLAKTSPSHVFVVAMMVASKYLYDDGEEDEVFNDEWASSAAMMLMDLNQAERNFLSAIDWNLFVDVARFLDGLAYVEAEVSQREAMSRGFFVYSDLVAISQFLPPLWNSLFNIVGSAFIVCIVGYTATIAMVASGTIIGNLVGVRVANHIENIYMNPSTHLTNQSHGLEFYEDIEDLIITPLNAAENEYVGFTCTGNTSGSARDVQAKNVVGKFNALHTLTTAFLLASSTASTKVANIISSFPIPNEPSFSLSQIFEPCLNCLSNLSYPDPFFSKKLQPSISKCSDRRQISYSRWCHQKEINRKNKFKKAKLQHSNDNSPDFTDVGSLHSSRLENSDYEEQKLMNLANHNSGITVISIFNPRLANYFIVTSNDIDTKGLSSNFQYLGLREIDKIIPENKYHFNYMLTNEIKQNVSQFASPFKQPNDYLLDMELPWFLEKKMSSNILKIISSWMWSSLPSTLSINIHEIISIGWQVKSLPLFI